MGFFVRRGVTTLALGMILASQAHADGNFPDPLISTPPTPETIQKGLEADGYSQTINGYIWGYPLVRMERVIRDYIDVSKPQPATSYRAPLNQIGWAKSLADPSVKDMPTSNNDTLYMSAVVNLTEPYVLTVPDTHDRYYVVDVFDMWQELEHYIGRRSTGTKAGKFVLVPPGWKGELPKDAKRLDVSTSKVWLWGRLHVIEGEDMAPVTALQKQFELTPLSGKPHKDETLPPLPAIGDDPQGFFTHLAAALKDNPVKPVDTALYGQLSRIGLTDAGFDPSKLPEATRKGIADGLKDGPSVAYSSLTSNAVIRNGWTWATSLDDFGYKYPLRAMVAGPYLGGQGEKEAMYPTRSADSAGKALDGSNGGTYEIKLSSAPPVDAFWSLTIYKATDKLLVDNPINRYKIGPTTKGLKTAADGSITIVISHDKPTGENASNWLPAPDGVFTLFLRLYQPSDAILNGQWPLPQVVKIK
ncbi:DUF1254 domain-containing protein [Pseudomonas alkylphenolica]|uniref:DUF1254 domain-containing protein n=1 Tax=Pseudomonas alkylphenolica TaxID=237609 RepID=A0A443ZT45_9PSED|nr:DUF1254 domain-containing protein [Pseudomonas alkylphenolica]RWU22861.1 DUF1254 domain-containing protein [Pseudomonas alkylphenolica]